MAFDFLGTFTKQDIDNLQSYLQGELDKIDVQINYMLMEQDKLQKTLTKIIELANKKGIKLRQFYKSFLRRINSKIEDTDTAIAVQQIKEPYYLNIKYRDEIEHRIKKLMDRIEQIQERIHLLRISKSEFRSNFESINALFDSFHTNLVVEKEVT